MLFYILKFPTMTTGRNELRFKKQKQKKTPNKKKQLSMANISLTLTEW